VRRHNGAPGIDRTTLDQVEEYGWSGFSTNWLRYCGVAAIGRYLLVACRMERAGHQPVPARPGRVLQVRQLGSPFREDQVLREDAAGVGDRQPAQAQPEVRWQVLSFQSDNELGLVGLGTVVAPRPFNHTGNRWRSEGILRSRPTTPSRRR
jgi:hypothetical protein